ncbi:MAG: TonB-dependent receptor [Bryobacteraceae bacterium]|nr:TonB-dependent receptor [Bryobacteraceae bacterium]
MRHLWLWLLAAGVAFAAGADTAATSVSVQAGEEPESILYEDLPVVETAALYSQTLQEAPASVTVITAQEIQQYGYRTLAEALSNVRGFHFTSDGALYFAGVRGFSQPGDYNSRLLVLVNGHPMTDNVYGAMYMFGQDFGIDMDLVQRIEVVRGPTSALYGANGVFATINIFTKAPADAPRGQVSTELGSFGEKKLALSAAARLGGCANLLLSASGFNTTGRTIDAAGHGRATHLSAEHGYHTFAHLTCRNWSVMANFSDHRIIVPIGWYGADYGDTGTYSFDVHNFVEASWTGDLNDKWSARWRLYYDQFRYFGNYNYFLDGGAGSDRDFALGDWIGTQFSLGTSVPRVGKLVFGSQLSADARNVQTSYAWPDEGNPYRHTVRPDRAAAWFFQQEWNASPRWTLFAGARLDDTKIHPAFISPRAGAVYKATETTAYKFLFGRAFRNPSTFERFWEPNPLLRAERMYSLELVREQRLHKRVDLIASFYDFHLHGLIEGVPVNETTLQYRNVAASHATGLEIEAAGRPADWLETSASLALQRSRYEHSNAGLPNSPNTIAQFRLAAPLARQKLILSAAGRYLSSRRTLFDDSVGPVVLADITLTTRKLHPDFDLQFGVRNLADRRYADPASAEHLLPTFPRAGRSVFLKLTWRYKE